jgi:hypothetical protein
MSRLNMGGPNTIAESLDVHVTMKLFHVVSQIVTLLKKHSVVELYLNLCICACVCVYIALDIDLKRASML